MWAFVVAYRHWAAVQLLCGSAHGTLFHRPEEHGTEERGQKVCMYAFFETFWTMNFFMNIRTYVRMHACTFTQRKNILYSSSHFCCCTYPLAYPRLGQGLLACRKESCVARPTPTRHRKETTLTFATRNWGTPPLRQAKGWFISIPTFITAHTYIHTHIHTYIHMFSQSKYT